jgi:hypothetical protein
LKKLFVTNGRERLQNTKVGGKNAK